MKNRIKNFFICVFIGLFVLVVSGSPLVAEELELFNELMKTWDKERVLALEFLDEAEKYYKDGDELNACSYQEKASIAGIKATESLLKAMELRNSTDNQDNIKAGLDKWKQLGNLC